MVDNGWYGLDLDGTLAFYDHFRGADHIGEPIPEMVAFVKRELANGRKFRIFTARVAPATIMAHARDQKEAEETLHRVVTAIANWSFTHLGVMLPLTATKDYMMIGLYDDRCVQMITNTGMRADGLDL